ncbi:MAG TPA: hypothetical protein VMR99_00345 [Candidatus Paceibacterota bacterium]|nr:hypothetical protein [Candidatus Paceibacterota bacterium]
MKKIIVDKTEGIAEVIDRMLNEPDGEVSIVIPKGSALGRSVSNFHLLKREADSAGRSIVIESVDETILAFAKESHIEASHPLWKGVRGAGGFSDIVSRREDAADPLRGDLQDNDDEEDGEKEKFSKKAPSVNKAGKKPERAVAKDTDGEERGAFDGEAEDEPEEKTVTSSPTPVRNRFFDAAPDLDDEDEEDRAPRRFPSKAIMAIVIIIIVIAAAAAYAASVFFDHADITINFKQTPWSYQDNFIASKSAAGIDPTTNTIPAQIFTATKNVTESFPGSLVQQVSQKAQGMITIYNAYSAASQELVATTRFLTPNGQIFRIVSNVTVPGETTVNGALTPSSITVPIVADQAGPDYNVGPVAKLTIPGFANDPGREAGFYGVITASTTGGFVGQRATPTAADISNAKASTTALLEASVQSGFSGTYPNNFEIPDGATTTTITTLTVNTSTDANGNFTVFGVATLQAIGFDQTALQNYLLSLAQAQEASSTFKTISLSYGDVTPNFTTGQVAFALSAQGSLEPAFSAAEFATSIEGQSIAAARNTISGLPQLADGEISMWPSWLWSIPSDPSKIHITVN